MTKKFLLYMKEDIVYEALIDFAKNKVRESTSVVIRQAIKEYLITHSNDEELKKHLHLLGTSNCGSL